MACLRRADLRACVLLSVLVFVVLPCISHATADFDLFVFIRQFAGGFCKSHDCIDLPEDVPTFTIKGLCPNYKNGSYPFSCQGSNFSKTAVGDLLPDLRRYWPSYLNKSSAAFWSFEWSKHGSCSGMDQHKFFKKALHLNEDYDLEAALHRAGIPLNETGTYTVVQLNNAIYKEFGHFPSLRCDKAHSTLLEVWMCFDKNLTLTSCPTAISKTFCSVKIQLPVLEKRSNETSMDYDDGGDSPPRPRPNPDSDHLFVMVLSIMLCVTLIVFAAGVAIFYQDSIQSGLQTVSHGMASFYERLRHRGAEREPLLPTATTSVEGEGI